MAADQHTDKSNPSSDVRAVTDALRQQQAIVQNPTGEWMLLRHADVKAAALDDAVFSSQVSRFLQVPAGARVQLNWTSANRDETVFSNNAFAPQAHAADNLVYGIGKHVCPGRLLATWQLRIITQALLACSDSISLAHGQTLEREQPPLGGYHCVPIVLG